MNVAIKVIILSFISFYSHAEESASEKLIKLFPQIVIESVSNSSINGFEIITLDDGREVHITEKGDYFVIGDLFKLEVTEVRNLSEEARKNKRLSLLEGLSEKDFITYKAENEEKGSVIVFTDVDCGYCRKLHKEVAELNEKGITVKYAAYPRAGIDSGTALKMEAAWCADDSQTSLTNLKNGMSITPEKCENPIAKEYEIGRKIGLEGTPAIVLEDGTLIGGYLPADKLINAVVSTRNTIN